MNAGYFLAWNTFRLVFSTYFRWRICNAERVPAQGPVILTCNHASFMDPPLVGTALPREISYLARDTLFRFPVIGTALRYVHALPVDRDGGGPAGLKRVLECIESGRGIVLFPEGTRTRDGRLQSARSGIGLVVVRTHAPVVPVRIFGSFEALPKGVWIPRPKQIVIKFGEPMHFEALRREAKQCTKSRLREIYQQVTDEVMRGIARLEPHEDISCFP